MDGLELPPEEVEAAHLPKQDEHGEVQRHEAGDWVQDGDGRPLAEGGAGGKEGQDPGDVGNPDQQGAEREPGQPARETAFDEVEREDGEDEEADERVDP